MICRLPLPPPFSPRTRPVPLPKLWSSLLSQHWKGGHGGGREETQNCPRSTMTICLSGGKINNTQLVIIIRHVPDLKTWRSALMLLQPRMSPGFQDLSESNRGVCNVDGERGKLRKQAPGRRGWTSECGHTLVDMRGNICAHQQHTVPACPPCLFGPVGESQRNCFWSQHIVCCKMSPFQRPAFHYMYLFSCKTGVWRKLGWITLLTFLDFFPPLMQRLGQKKVPA